MNMKKKIFICTAAIVMSAVMFFAACDNPWLGAKPGGSEGEGGGNIDVTNWTAVTNSTFDTSHINGIAYGGGKFVTVGSQGKIAYSAGN